MYIIVDFTENQRYIIFSECSFVVTFIWRRLVGTAVTMAFECAYCVQIHSSSWYVWLQHMSGESDTDPVWHVSGSCFFSIILNCCVFVRPKKYYCVWITQHSYWPARSNIWNLFQIESASVGRLVHNFWYEKSRMMCWGVLGCDLQELWDPCSKVCCWQFSCKVSLVW
jgi:hypothetical protein